MSELFHPSGSLAQGHDSVVITPENAGWEYSGLTVFGLQPGESRKFLLDGIEAAVLPMTGSATVGIDGQSFDLAGRTDLFRQRTDFAFAPLGSTVTIESAGGGEFALCTAVAAGRAEPSYVPVSEVAVEVRGGGVVTRQINNFMAVGDFGADTLIAVEVITPEGNISSYPPHKHDEKSEVESELEEIYYFRIDGDHGFGLFNAYAADGSFHETMEVRDGDVFLCPKGYHGPAVALPGYHMYYLNIMAGPERVWKFTDDPRHGWQRAVIDGQAPDPRLPLSGEPEPTLGV